MTPPCRFLAVLVYSGSEGENAGKSHRCAVFLTFDRTAVANLTKYYRHMNLSLFSKQNFIYLVFLPRIFIENHDRAKYSKIQRFWGKVPTPCSKYPL